MKLPDLISALERNEYAEVLRGTKYDWQSFGHKQNADNTLLKNAVRGVMQDDAEANAATVTVLREAVRELREASGDLLNWTQQVEDNEKIGFYSREDAQKYQAAKRKVHDAYQVAAPLVNEKEGE